MYVALEKKRISRPVVLEIKLEVVSRPGVLFCDIAASRGATVSLTPKWFTLRLSKFKLTAEQRFEVLVPGWIPPNLIKIPKVDAFVIPLELRGRLPDSNLVECTLRSEIGVRDSTFSTTTQFYHSIAA